MSTRRHRLAVAALTALGVSILARPAEPQDVRLAVLVLPAEDAPERCLCKAEERKSPRARRCDGTTVLEKSAAHSNGAGIVCSSLGAIEVETDPGRCRSHSGDAQARASSSACREIEPRPCEARIRFVFGAHSAACHPNPPNGFWVTSSTGSPSPTFRAIGSEIALQVRLRPDCGSCGDAVLSVAMPDGANGEPGTVLYRYMVAVDCVTCAASTNASAPGGV